MLKSLSRKNCLPRTYLLTNYLFRNYLLRNYRARPDKVNGSRSLAKTVIPYSEERA